MADRVGDEPPDEVEDEVQHRADQHGEERGRRGVPGVDQLLDRGNRRLHGQVELIDSIDGEVAHDLAGAEDQPADRADEQVVAGHDVPPASVDQRDRQHGQGLGEFLGYADGDDAAAQVRGAAVQRVLQRDRQRYLRRQRDRRHHEEHRPGHVFRADNDPEHQQPGDGEVGGEDPGHVVKRGRVRVRAQDDQRDRRHADQEQEQDHGHAAERVVPDPVPERQQFIDLRRAARLS